MSRFITLPNPLSSTAITLGQLITDPFLAESQPQQNSTSAYNSSIRPRSNALTNPKSAFNALRRDTSTQTLLRNCAHQNQQLYYVAAIQTSTTTHPSNDTSIIDAQTERTHVRRVDSASSLDVEDKPTDTTSVCAVELWKVRARVGSPSEPHSVDDVDYEWSYHILNDEDDLQLSIGLGKAVVEEELRRVTGRGVGAGNLDSEQEDTDENWDESEDEAGLGGF